LISRTIPVSGEDMKLNPLASRKRKRDQMGMADAEYEHAFNETNNLLILKDAILNAFKVTLYKKLAFMVF